MSTASLLTRTRMVVQDVGQPFSSSVVLDGEQVLFDLPVESVSTIVSPPVVTNNGVVVNPTNYVVYGKSGVILFNTPPGPPGPTGNTLRVTGITYDFFDDDEVTQAVTDAFNMHVIDQDPLPVVDPGLGQTGIPLVEELLVSILAAIELLWLRTTEAAQEVDIHTPEGVAIPRGQRYQQMINQHNLLMEQYKIISLAMGVGLFRIQILNLRRVSLTTNRLVPVYREQEYNQPYPGILPTAGPVGTLVTINGRYFTGTTQVAFGGVPATSFTVVSDTCLTAFVPAGAQTGQIGITTPGGVFLSTAQFVVGQPAPFINYGPELISPPIPPGL